MPKNLVIVESPAKARTIERYLGADYRVLASYGHVRDLPENPGKGKFGVDVDHDFEPEYVISDVTMQPMNEENPLWKGSSSQWLNLGPAVLSLVAAVGIIIGAWFFPPACIALLLPVGYIVWKFLVVRTRTYEITSQRIRVTSGVFNQLIDEIELYRVKDTQMFRPIWMRLTGLATIHLETSDRSIPNLLIPAVRGGAELRELIREQVELTRDRKRVREMDFDQVGVDLGGEINEDLHSH